MNHYISTKELGKALKLSKPTSLLDQARKHFKTESLQEVITKGVKLPQGGYAMFNKDILLTKHQAHQGQITQHQTLTDHRHYKDHLIDAH